MFPPNNGFPGGFGGGFPPGGFGGGFPPGGFGGGSPPGSFDWSGMGQVPPDESGAFFGIGSFTVEIERCLLKKSEKSGDLFFIVECLVHESTNPQNPPGSRASWLQKMHAGAEARMSYAAIKAFLFAVLGLDSQRDAAYIASEIDPQINAIMQRVVGVENLLAGCKVELTTIETLTKRERKPFTKHKWSPYAYEANGEQRPNPLSKPLSSAAPDPQTSPQVAHAQAPAAYAPPAIPPGAQLSPDGNYYWNGSTWVPVPR